MSVPGHGKAPKRGKIVKAKCNGMDFYAPKPNGQLLCKTPMLTLQAYPEDKNMEINTKCRIMCGDALPIPEYTFCTEDGWDVNWEEVKCDATRDGLSTSTQVGIILGAVVLVIFFTIIANLKPSQKPYLKSEKSEK